MLLKVFVKEECPNCPAAKELASRFRFARIYDMDDMDGLAEAAYHSVLCTPSLILVDDSGLEVQSWRCKVPNPKEIFAYA